MCSTCKNIAAGIPPLRSIYEICMTLESTPIFHSPSGVVKDDNNVEKENLQQNFSFLSNDVKQFFRLTDIITNTITDGWTDRRRI